MPDYFHFQSLNELYKIQEKTFKNFTNACTLGCTTCCTRNVVLTSLEAHYLMQGLEAETELQLKEAFSQKPPLPRMKPNLTINSMATLYMSGEDPPEDPADPAWWPCPLLNTKTGKCNAYTYRPMACRCMISKIRCETSNIADMEEETILLHTLFMQAVEHLDADGKSANLMDLVMETLHPGTLDIALPQNRKIPMLMIPQSFQEKLRPLLDEIGHIIGSAHKEKKP